MKNDIFSTFPTMKNRNQNYRYLEDSFGWKIVKHSRPIDERQSLRYLAGPLITFQRNLTLREINRK